MDKKKITAIVIAGAVLLFIIAVDLFLIMSKKQDPVESLQKSIGYADGKNRQEGNRSDAGSQSSHL